jgi:hypothetical protein
MQKMLKKVSEKPIFKCGIVHHKVGSPFLSDISNTNYAKKMLSKPAKQSTKVQSFAPPNFKFKVRVLLFLVTFIKGCKKCEYNFLSLWHSSILTGDLLLN